jgi:hypothetical protein
MSIQFVPPHVAETKIRRKFAKLSLSYSYRDHWQCRPLVWNMPANCKGVTEHTVDLSEVCLFVQW